MAAVFHNANSAKSRLFEAIPGALSQTAYIHRHERLSWPSDLQKWLLHFSRPDFNLLCAQRGCLLMMTPDDYLECYLPLIDNLPDPALHQQAYALEVFRTHVTKTKERGLARKIRFRIGISEDAFGAAFGADTKGTIELRIVAKRRWAEIWHKDAFATWQTRLRDNSIPGKPLPPPPFTPDVIDTYIKACGLSAPCTRKAA